MRLAVAVSLVPAIRSSVWTAATPLPNFDMVPVGAENDFESRDDSEHVREIEITQVRDAEDLALHGALAVGDDGAEAFSEILDDHAWNPCRRAL